MKKMIFYLAASTLGITQLTAQTPMNWTLLNTGTTKNIRDISFINRDTGFIAGDNGLLKMTTNGGATWTDMVIPAGGQGVGNNNNIKVAQFYKYSNTVAGVIFWNKFTDINRTYDLSGGWMLECGGGLFTYQDSVCSINNYHHSTSYTEYTAGGNCLEGGGTIGYFGGFCFTFDSLISDTSFNGWADITANQNDVIVAVGADGYYSNNPISFGATYNNSGSGFNYVSVDWSDTSTVFAFNDSGFWGLEKSTDGGNSFVIDSLFQPTFYYPVVDEIDFTDNDWGVLGGTSNGTDGIIITKRGNALIDYFLTDSSITSVFVIDSLTAFAGGLNGDLYKYTNPALTLDVEPAVANVQFSIFPNPQSTQSDLLNLFSEEVVKEIIIYDITGKVLLNELVQKQGQLSLNTGLTKAGTYIVRIITDKGIGTRKYLVN